MAKVHIENPPAIMEFLKSDLILEDFSSWSWPGQNDSTNGVTNLSYREFMQFLRNLEKEKLKKNPPENKDEKNFDGIGGLFRIRWNIEKAYDFCPRTGTIYVAYGFRASISSLLSITSCLNDALYIGKARDVRKRITEMFSKQKNSNSIARKIGALIDETTPKEASNQKELIKNFDPNKVKKYVVFDFVREEHPVKRDFMKAYAVSNEKPCLNIGLEH